MQNLYRREWIGVRSFEVEDWRYHPEFRTCAKENKLEVDYALVKLKSNIDLIEPLSLSGFSLLNLFEAGQGGRALDIRLSAEKW
jgi:hypothetical protein